MPLPNAGTQMFFMEDIKNNRSDTASLSICDGTSRSASRQSTACMLMADLFNVTNSNSVINFNLTNGANFNRINATLDPRTFMLGVRFDF